MYTIKTKHVCCTLQFQLYSELFFLFKLRPDYFLCVFVYEQHMARGPCYYVLLLFNGTAVLGSSPLQTRHRLPGNCAPIG